MKIRNKSYGSHTMKEKITIFPFNRNSTHFITYVNNKESCRKINYIDNYYTTTYRSMACMNSACFSVKEYFFILLSTEN